MSSSTTGTRQAAIGTLLSRGRAAWPALTTSDDVFRDYIAAHLSDDGELAEGAAADMYLACACAYGEPRAIAAFTAAHSSTIQAAVRRVRTADHRQAEAVQLTLDRLLVRSDQGPPRIAQYSGRASLGSFVSVVAVRIALSLVRGWQEHGGDDDALGGLADAHDDPEQRYLKRLYQEQFRAAFGAALEQLPAYDRLILRYQIVDGLSIDQLAAVFGRTRSTMGRHVLEARSRLVTDTKRELKSQLNVEHTALSSVLRLVQSSVDVSVRRLLGSAQPAAQSS